MKEQTSETPEEKYNKKKKKYGELFLIGWIIYFLLVLDVGILFLK